MRGMRAFTLALLSVVALSGCEETSFDPTTISASAFQGPALTLTGTVRSAIDGSPVQGARIRLFGPGDPYAYPYTVVWTETTSGGSFSLRLPSSFPSPGDCLGLRLSARAPGYAPEANEAGVICTPSPQEFDFTLSPAGFDD